MEENYCFFFFEEMTIKTLGKKVQVHDELIISVQTEIFKLYRHVTRNHLKIIKLLLDVEEHKPLLIYKEEGI